MTAPLSPERWAFNLTRVLNAAYGEDRFPVDVPQLAKDYTAQCFPADPIISVQGDNLPKFDGALFKAPQGRKGWGIIYNNGIRSAGRINFTLAHEFGHFLLHRLAYPDGFQCGQQDVVRWDSEYGQIEHQANVFAATLLMPLDDFRRQIPADASVSLDLLRHCTDRYRVSLLAATLRWLQYTEKRAVLVVSREGYILWARSSQSALKTGAYFRTRGAPVAIPAASLPLNPGLLDDGCAAAEHPAGVWFTREGAHEVTVAAELYDFAISLLLLNDEPPPFQADDDRWSSARNRFRQRYRG